MTRHEKDRLTKVLKAQIRSHSHLHKSREEIATLTVVDQFERLQLASDRDVLLHHVSQESATLRELEDALQRLEDETYGLCIACEDPISPKRLAAIPWVAHCIRCKEEIERNQPMEKSTMAPVFDKGVAA